MITNIWYMAHAYVGDRRNLAMARRWLQLLREIYAAPIIAPWIELCEALPETEDNRAFGIDISCDIVKKCAGVILVGEKITDGMHMESAKAAQVLVLTTGAAETGKNKQQYACSAPVTCREPQSCSWFAGDCGGGKCSKSNT